MSVIVQSTGWRTERIQHVEDEHGARALVHGAYGRLGFTATPRPGSCGSAAEAA
jgi:hypothetical protein